MGKRGRKPQVRWWDRQGGGYFCTFQGRKVCLVLSKEDDYPDGPNYKAATAAFAKLICQEEGKGSDGYAVSALFNAYRQALADAERASMLNNADYYLKPFSDLHGKLAVGELKGYHVREWLKAATTWGPSSRRLAVKMLQGALNWGAKEGLVSSNPLKGKVEIPKDKPRGRECRLAPELAALLIAEAPPELGQVLRMLRGTGARPEEISDCTARDFKGDRIVYHWNATEGHRHKTARRGKEVDRVIFLTPELAELCRDQAAKYPSGPIFRTPLRRRWSKQNRTFAFRLLLKTEKVAKYLADHKIKPANIVPYSFRHSWISEWIDSGRSVKLCADLCGTSVAQIEKVYGHTDQQNLQNVYLAFMNGEQHRPPA
jgi:integrase